eukprot:908378-Lingulodinium_polyedra.AAC.1
MTGVAVPTQQNEFMPGVGAYMSVTGLFQSGASLDAGGKQKATMPPNNITMAPSSGRALMISNCIHPTWAVRSASNCITLRRTR